MKDFFREILLENVSRETLHKIHLYIELVKQWNEKFSLIQENTYDNFMSRHIYDSLQLLKYINIDKSYDVADVGTGAGLPGVVLSIAKPDLSITLIESNLKKCVFLNTVKRELGLNLFILNQRVEKVEHFYDLIVSRACAPLVKLMMYCSYVSRETSTLFLHKGKDVDKEIKIAQNKFDFIYEKYPSLTDAQGCILKVSNLRRV